MISASTSPQLSPREKLLPKLRDVREMGDRKWRACCPVHEANGQHDPSLDITECPDGKLLIVCRACHATGPQVAVEVGLAPSELFPPREDRRHKSRPGRLFATYEYRDADGVVVYRAQEFRLDENSPKSFSQSRPNGSGGWINNMRGVERVPYRLPELIAAPIDQTIYIVEGEKKVEALAKWGQVATCNVGGAGKFSKSFAKWFSGRTVIILPDNDPTDDLGRNPGMDHARDVRRILKPVAASVRILQLPGLGPKEDIVDWQRAGHGLPEFLQLVAAMGTGLVLADRNAGANAATNAGAPDSTTEPAAIDELDLRNRQSWNDVGNAKRLIRQHKARLRYCAAHKKWLRWTGKVWANDESGVIFLAQQTIESLWKELTSFGRDSDGLLDKAFAFVRGSLGGNALKRMVDVAACQPEIQVEPRQLDADPWLFNAENGIVDLRTGEIVEHDPERLQTKISPCEYDPAVEPREWPLFLDSIFQGNRELVDYVQRLAGSWATGCVKDQILAVFHGHGSNGKSVFFDVMAACLGSDYFHTAPSDFLMAKLGEQHPTAKAGLFGKRLVVCSETEEGKRLAESTVKELTGSDRISARRMREDFWEFQPTHKLVLVTNHRPMIRGTDHGIWRRIRLVPFETRYWNPEIGESGPEELRRDEMLPSRLLAERAGILAWIVRGAIQWQQTGESAPDVVRTQTSEYREVQDVLGSFLSECCEVSRQLSVQSSSLYKTYVNWTKANGEFSWSQKRFSQAMHERGIVKVRGAAGMTFHGVAIVDDWG